MQSFLLAKHQVLAKTPARHTLKLGLALALVWLCAGAVAQSQKLAVTTVDAAVQQIIARLGAHQRSIVLGTPKDNLFMLQGEWGDDIEELLDLDGSNEALRTAVCAGPCKSERATLLLMEKAWELLRSR
jgi:hypothetical protein